MLVKDLRADGSEAHDSLKCVGLYNLFSRLLREIRLKGLYRPEWSLCLRILHKRTYTYGTLAQLVRAPGS